ncbi:MAG: LLM class flavin-dependent oxidoreductase, partial [Actinomycetota bacterium]
MGAPLPPIDLELVGADPGDVARLAARAEAAGVARLWAPELHRSATVPLAVAAGATRRVEIATGIALAFTRSPMTLALEALDLDELSGGRLVLGLGAGVRRLNMRWHSVPYDPPVRRMRETVAAVRTLVAALARGEDARSPGRLVDVDVTGLRRGLAAPRAAIPVWLAAVNPGMARLAGEIADGLLDHPVTTRAWLDDEIRPALAAGAARAGRPAPPVAAAVTCAVDDDDPGRARRAAALTVGFYATVRTYEPLFAGHGFGGRLGRIRRAFAAGDADALADAVGDDMVDAFALAGTGAAVAAGVAERARGVDRLWLAPPHHLQAPADRSGWQA